MCKSPYDEIRTVSPEIRRKLKNIFTIDNYSIEKVNLIFIQGLRIRLIPSLKVLLLSKHFLDKF